MSLEGIVAVQARISEIRRLVAPTAPADRAAATTPSDAASFEAVLAAATGTAAGPASASAASAVTSLPSATAGASAVGGVSALTPAARLAPGRYGRLEPPAELRGYGNGRIPAAALAEIGGGHRLHAPAATAFSRLQADARAAGVTIGVTDSYRDYAGQVSVAARKGLYSQGGLAATPGTSTHGWGLSVDLRLDGQAQQWMREHGWRYGFVEDVPREPWHWTYRPAG